MVSRKFVTSEEKTGTIEVIDGQELFSDGTRVLARLSEQFQKLPKVPGDIDQEALNNIYHSTLNTSLDEISTMEEMNKAIGDLKDGKAPGEDGIPAEIWKCSRNTK